MSLNPQIGKTSELNLYNAVELAINCKKINKNEEHFRRALSGYSRNKCKKIGSKCLSTKLKLPTFITNMKW